MPRRVLHFVWYATLFGALFVIFEKVTNGVTGGLKKGMANALGV